MATVLSQVRLEIPAEWTDFSVLTFVGPDEGKPFRPNAVVTSEPLPASQSLAQYAEAQCAAAQREVRKFKLHRSEPGSEGRHVVEYSFQSQEGHPLRQLQAFTLHEDRVVTLSLTHREADFEAARPTFERVLRSFRLTT